LILNSVFLISVLSITKDVDLDTSIDKMNEDLLASGSMGQSTPKPLARNRRKDEELGLPGDMVAMSDLKSWLDESDGILFVKQIRIIINNNPGLYVNHAKSRGLEP
jgi:hypothetical protein